MHVYYEYRTFISQYNKCEKFLWALRCWTFISQTLNVPTFIHLQSLLKQMLVYKTCHTQWNDITSTVCLPGMEEWEKSSTQDRDINIYLTWKWGRCDPTAVNYKIKILWYVINIYNICNYNIVSFTRVCVLFFI